MCAEVVNRASALHEDSPHRHRGHRHGLAGRPAEGRRPRRARLGRARLPADVDPAGRAGHPGASRASRPRTSTGGPTGRGRQRLPQGSRRGAGGAGAGHPPRPRSRRCSASCSCSSRRSVVVAGTHGKTTTLVAAGARADRGRARPVVPDRRRAAQLPPVLAAGRRRATSSSRATSTTPPSSTRSPSSCTTARRSCILTSVEFDHADIFRDEEAVKAAFRKFVALIPADGCWSSCAASPGAMEVAKAARCQVTTYAPPRLRRRLDLRGQRPHARAAAPTLHVAARASASSAPSRPACPASTTSRTCSASSPSPPRAGRRRCPRIARGVPPLPGRAPPAGGARRRAGVTVVDDFAHHPTAIRETLLAPQGPLRPRQADRRLRAALGHQPAQRLPDRASPTRWPSPTRSCWRRCTRRRRSRRPSAWTSSGWPPICAARTCPARLIPTRRRHRRAHLADARRPGRHRGGDVARATTAACTTSCCIELGDPVRAGARRGQAQDREPARPRRASRTRCWNSSGRITWSSPATPTAMRWSAASPSSGSRTWRCCACWPSPPSGAARGWATCWSRRPPNKARAQGVRHLYLVTDGAQGYFGEKLGFVAIDRKDVVAADPGDRRIPAGALEGRDLDAEGAVAVSGQETLVFDNRPATGRERRARTRLAMNGREGLGEGGARQR